MMGAPAEFYSERCWYLWYHNDMAIDINSIYHPTPWMGEETVDLKRLQGWLKWNGVNMAPPYQRGSCWTSEQQSNFMGHILTGGDLLPIVVQRVPDSEFSEMLDGKQRVEAMIAWLEGKCAAVLPDRSTLFRYEITGPIGRVVFTVKFVNLPFEERKRFYVRFNSAGTPHTRQELEAALKAQPGL
jgi:hypothetical protein